MIGKNIAIDIGTKSVKVFVRGKGIVSSEASAVAFDKTTDEVIAIGTEAAEMIQKTTNLVEVKMPIKNGVICDYETTKLIFSKTARLNSKHRLFKPNYIIVVPASCTPLQKRMLIDVACNCDAGKVSVIEEPVASAYGAALSIERPYGTLVVDFGAGTTDIAVITMGSVSVSSTINLGGDSIDEAITNYIRHNKNLAIGRKTAENIKNTVASAANYGESVEIAVHGKNTVTSAPDVVYVSSKEITEAISPVLDIIINEIRKVIEKIPPEMYIDICNSGMIITGGCAKIRNLKKLFEDKFKIPVTINEDGENTAVKGAGYILKNFSKFKDEAFLFKLKYQSRFSI